jgi:predicted RNase H-like nuclease (RuvC/YqgF family)
VYSDIEDALLGIKRSALELEKAEPEGRFHLKMVKVAASNRDNMVKQVRLLMNNINIPETTDIRTVLEFHENAIQTLTMCLENMMKSYQYTKMVFFEDSKKVIAEVNELGRLLNQLVEPLNGNKKVLDAFDNAEKKILNIKNLDHRIDDEKKTIEDLDEKIDSLKKKLELNRDNLAQLSDSEQWKQYLNRKNDLVDLENKAKKAESDIITLLVPLNKPLQRLKQMNEAGKYDLPPAIKKDLHLCLTDPKSVCTEFFVEVENIIQKDTVAFNPEKRDRILEQIKYSVSKIGDFIKEYQTIASNFNSKKDEIEGMNIVQEAANLRNRISSLQDDLAFAEKELENLKKLLNSLEYGVTLEKNELQQTVFAIDNRKRIIY